MSKNLLKILELNLLQLMQEVYQLQARKDHRLQRDKEQQEAIREDLLLKNQPMVKLLELEEIWTTIIMLLQLAKVIQMLKVEVEKNLPKH